MATTRLSDIPSLEKQLKDLREQASGYQNKLNMSPTALGGEGTPTSFDISNQEKLKGLKSKINQLNDDRLRARWYGDTDKQDTADSEGKSMGFFGKSLDFISRPLYGIVGATKHITGQGTDSLWGDIADNIARNKNTFGDVLRSAHVPGGAAAPLGFALDITFDPINWLTMGSAALVPKIATGAVKGVKTGRGIGAGLASASKAGVLEKATTVAKFTPGVKRTKFFEKLGKASMGATKKWEELSGITPELVVSTKGATGTFREGLNYVFKKTADSIPGSEKFLENFIYDPVNWIRQSRYKDILQRNLEPGITDIHGAIKAKVAGESIEPFMKSGEIEMARELAKKKLLKKSSDVGQLAIEMESIGDVSKINKAIKVEDVEKAMAKLEGTGYTKKVLDEAADFTVNADDVTSILNDQHGIFISGDPIENTRRLLDNVVDNRTLTLDELGDIVKSGAMDATGVKWFDKMMEGVRGYTIKTDRKMADSVRNIGKTALDNYEKGMGIFRVAKVAASPSAWTNAVVGNMIMTHMAGANIGPVFLKRLWQSKQYYTGKTGAAARLDMILRAARGGEATGSPVVKELTSDFLSAGRNTLGDTRFLGNAAKGEKGISELVAEELSMHGKDAAIISENLDPREVSAAIAEIEKEAASKMEDVASVAAKLKGEAKLPNKSTFAMTRKEVSRKGAEGVSTFDTGGGMLSQDILSNSAAAEMFNSIAKKAAADPDNKTYQVLNFLFNKAPEGYEKIDQSYKMATLLVATHDGYTMKEIRKLRQFVDIDPEGLMKVSDEVAKKAGEMRYTLPTKTALELANVMYLNYAAMPAAVKVLRNFPIMGSPFISFMYGMSLKTGQTLVHNPAAFNKVTFAMSEFGGDKTPLEKKALDSSYYSYLKEPGMMRMPFFEKNPIYLNMTNMIPYYSLNMFNPSQTKYGDSLREKVSEVWQKSPLMKDPIGSVMFDYLIQPLIIGEAIRPQGQFGQPLYPLDATGVEKVGYGARSLGEAFVPNIASYAGLLTPEAAADYIPSYRWRSLAKAKVGKNQLGITSKEAPASRTIREMLKTSGISVQAPVNTTFVNKKK